MRCGRGLACDFSPGGLESASPGLSVVTGCPWRGQDLRVELGVRPDLDWGSPTTDSGSEAGGGCLGVAGAGPLGRLWGDRGQALGWAWHQSM